MKLLDYLKVNYLKIVLYLFIPILTIVNFSHHSWVKPENVIAWDVKSYYAYLPALFIYKDISLEFRNDNPEKFSDLIWPTPTPTGKKAIITSMGMSFLYLPFFLIGHLVAHLTHFEADGYTTPYAFALHFAVLFYMLLGLFYLRKVLRFYYSELTAFFTIIIVFVGTNLLYYTAYSACMTHAYNFALFSIFIYHVIKWHESQDLKRTIYIGLLLGLISLIRPTNIIIVLILLLWDVSSFRGFSNRIRFFLEKYKLVLIMLLFFFLVWSPQMIYWKYISGKFFFFSYAGAGGKFFWDHPQISNILFSYRKGWFVFTPVMIFAVGSIALLWKNHRGVFVPVIVFLLVNIYVQSSWWCWWFGGSFGNRAFIESYGILAIPLAALLSLLLQKKKMGIAGLIFLLSLTYYNTFQIKQHNHGAHHYWWQSRASYWEVFLKGRPTDRYWELIPVPDYDKARLGMYVSKNLIKRYTGDLPVTSEMIIDEIKDDLFKKGKFLKAEKVAGRFHISVDSVLTVEAWNIYEKKRNLSKYIEPIEARLLKNVPANK